MRMTKGTTEVIVGVGLAVVLAIAAVWATNKFLIAKV